MRIQFERSQSFLNTVRRKFRYTGRFSFMFVLTVAYAPEETPEGYLEVGAYGGTGQIVSVLRGCSGTVLHSEASVFYDASGSAKLVTPVSRSSHMVTGIRLGKWSSQARFARLISPGVYGSSTPITVKFSYTNPHLSLEAEKIGFGVGYIFGKVPLEFEASRNHLSFSGHIRYGSLHRSHLIMSVAEGEPLFSNGGVFDMGIGYQAGESGSMYTGVSFGFYDRPGLLQRGRFKLANNVDFELGGRWGRAGDRSEMAISGGIIYRIANK